MGVIKQSALIEQLLDRVSIVDVISKYIKLEKRGANYVGLCPFHADTNPSLFVSDKKRIYKCFSCGAAGNVLTFLQRFNKLSYGQALVQLAEMCGYSPKEISQLISTNLQDKNFIEEVNLNDDANDLFKLLLTDTSNQKYLDYLTKQRKITQPTINFFELGCCEKDGCSTIMYELLSNKDNIRQTSDQQKVWNKDQLLKNSLINLDRNGEAHDFFFKRITFPIKDKNGTIIGFTGRGIEESIQPKYLLSKETQLFSKRRSLYNLDQVNIVRPKILVLVEGNMDVISIYEAFDLNLQIDQNNEFVSVGLMGVELSIEHLQMIRSLGVNTIFLSLDNDQAGNSGTVKIGETLLKQKDLNVYVLPKVNGCKDFNDILVKYGKEKIKEVICKSNKQDFVSYYCQYHLSAFADKQEWEKNNILKSVLNFVRNYYQPMFLKENLKVISQMTHLDEADILYEFEVPKNYSSVKKEIGSPDHAVDEQRESKFMDKNIEQHRWSLQDCLDQVFAIIFQNPSFCEKIYRDINEKQLLQDFFPMETKVIIKIASYWMTKQEEHFDVLEIIKQMFAHQEIDKKTFIRITKNCKNAQWLKSCANVVIKNNSAALVDKINALFKELNKLQKQKELIDKINGKQ